ncbi:metal ABC transporter ATP-binding protein [Clostridium cellulovorans]|uniref:ABC transporter related n=1 Tax=Clostridium cellulovorans (strain ATCC 35296 / DSM 3052 / OCM 3 / 743B) TaxID=573061 RepID=D9SNN1_CLOC7|nr:metal ABC transporter ATP-binding protein [Clostridium cellulovorans]ADL49902.1 ABC transporter related [Clostridium cellulovorans 743B]
MIEIKSLSFSYNNKAPYIVNDVSLKINKGEYVSIIGENGCGKSTLIKLLLGIVKHSKGSVAINSPKIGYVPQRLDSNSSFPITVNEALQSHLKALKLKDKSLVDNILDSLGMKKYKHRLIGSLSGGQQQKIFIARALLGEPEVLILDEPSNNIDVKSQEEIYGIIKDLNLTKGVTVVSVEHNLKAARDNSTHIFEMTNNTTKLFDVEKYIAFSDLCE